MSTFNGSAVALIGKLGHGKTRLLNKVCGTHHVSQGGCRSATRDVELGYSKQHKIALLGTPGLGPTEEVARHLAAQKLALEFTPLSGIYIVLKCARDGDMIDDQINDIIDMVGEDGVRIIVTHSDVESSKEGFDVMDVKRSVSRLADISVDLIKVIGVETSGAEIEDFIHSTLLPQPVGIKLDSESVVKLAARSKQSRRISKAIRDLHGKIDAATTYCKVMTSSGRTHEHDIEIMDLQRATINHVREEKERIFRDAVRLTADEQTICYAQAGASLSVKLKEFVETTNTFLSWNVTDPSDPRNNYRACNHCGAVFAKVEGCDGTTRCGAIPLEKKSDSKKCRYSESSYDFYEDHSKWYVRAVRSAIRAASAVLLAGSNDQAAAERKSTGVFEAGCGQSINWSTMRPIEPALMKELGKVETMHAGKLEELSSRRFETDIETEVEVHKQNLQREITSSSQA